MWGGRLWHSICLIVSQILLVSCIEKSSVTFVIDDTISMQDYMDQVKSVSKKLMDIYLGTIRQNRQVVETVVVTFNDPVTKFWTKSSNRTDVDIALDSINAHTHQYYNPCPEYSMSGIYLGMNNSLPESTLFVYTDSDSQDRHLESTVIDLCQKTHSIVNFLMPSTICMLSSDEQLLIYYRIAHACGGNLLYLDKDDEFNQRDDWVNIFAKEETLLQTAFLPRNFKETRYQIVIDELVEYALITHTGWTYDLKMYYEDQEINEEKLFWFSKVKVLKVNNPGKYIIESKMHGPMIIEVKGKTEFTFKHGFSKEEPRTMIETTSQPIADTSNHLSVMVSDPSSAVTIKDVSILSLDNESIMNVTLNNKGGNFYTTEPFTPPNSTFRVALNSVINKNGREVFRYAQALLRAEPEI